MISMQEDNEDNEETKSNAKPSYKAPVTNWTSGKEVLLGGEEIYFPLLYHNDRKINGQKPEEATTTIKQAGECSRLDIIDAACINNMPTDDINDFQNDRRTMELQGLRCCYESERCPTSLLSSKFNERINNLSSTDILQQRLREKMPSQNEGNRDSCESKTSGPLLENYCKLLKELECQRRENVELCRDKKKLEMELELLKEEIIDYKSALESESASRERIQHDLRRLADSMERRPLHPYLSQQNIRTKLDQTVECNVEDIEHYKNQFRVYQEDFKQEKEEKEKLRVLNLKLASELEEAKQEIESRQRTLLMYAHIFSNGNQGQMVIPPAYMGRRVHSSPSTPSYNHGSSFAAARHTYPGSTFNEVLKEKHCRQDSISDIIPKGSREKKGMRFSFDATAPQKTTSEQKESFVESENCDVFETTRYRSKSVEL